MTKIIFSFYPLIYIHLLFKNQIVRVIGYASNVFWTLSIKCITPFKGATFISDAVMYWLSLLHNFIQQNLDSKLCAILVGTI